MEKTIKKLMAILLSICMLMTIFIPYRIEASQTTTKQNKTEVHPLELDNYIQAVTIEYQSGEDWIKITDDTKNIPADARIKITVNYKNIDAKELLNHNKTLRYHLPDLFQDSFVVLNSIQDANGNKIGTIKVEYDTQDVLLSFEESFLQQDEEENKKINGNFSVYATTDRQLIKGQPQQTIKFGEVTKKLNFEEDSDARLGNLELTKTEPSYSEENGNGYLTYTLIAKTGDDPMPDVVVKDQFTKNQTYIDSYIGVDTTKKTVAHQPNDKNLPYEGNGEQFESKVYLQDSTKPGTLIWEIGDMKAKEIRTLTYKVKVKDTYIGGASKGMITNTAKSYAKSYEHQSASSNFTPNAGMQIKKTASTYKKDPSGNGGTITYTVYVKANESNTYTLNNVKIHDNFSSGTNTTLLPYINYDENSFQLYEGNKADETKKLEIPENPHKGQENPYIVNDKKKECKIDFYLGKLKPGEERTLTYQVKISEDIFAMSNQEIKVKNTAAAYSDDTVSGGNQKFASATQEKSLGKKVWDRKLQSDPITKEEQINIPEQDKVYNSNMEISPLAVRSFKIPKASQGDWIRGSLYWIIDVQGNEIPAGTIFRDVPKTGNSTHLVRKTSIVGVYKGKLPTGKSFKDCYGTVRDLSGDPQLQKLIGNENNLGQLPQNADYQWESTGNNAGKYADIKLKKDVHLEENEHLYIILRTEPSNKMNSLRDAYTYTNELQTKDSTATDFVSQGQDSLVAAGGGNNFKEMGGIYERDDAGKWTTVSTINWNGPQKVLQNKITKAGTYIDWRLKVNYVGNLEGKVYVEDQLPKGLDLTYVRYFWIDPGIRNQNAPVMCEIPEYENDPQWEKLTLTGNLDRDNKKDYTSIAYYNKQTGKICMAVDNLKSGGASDKHSLEIQVVTRVNDEEVLLDGKTKSFNNTMTVKNEEGKIISNSTATANVSKKTIKKTKQDIRDGKLPFMITVNESGEDLIKGEDTITLVDEMKSPLQFDTDSIVVKDKNGNLITGISPKIETTDTGQKMSLTIPDNKKLTITYEATLNAAPDTDITVNNKAYWFGHSTTVAMIENTTVRYHVEAFAGTTTSPAVKVKKVDKENTSKALSGATFMIQEVQYDELKKAWEAPQDAKTYTEETDDTGVASFGKNDALSYNKVYCLREMKAPEGYVLDATPKYFAIAQKEGEAGEEIYPAQLTQWQKLGVEVYYLGATYKCNMYDSKGVLKVAKHFLDDKGNAITSKELPDGTFSFGLYEYKNAQTDYSKEQKLQILTITNKNGTLSYKCNGKSVDKPQFTGLSVGGKFSVFELDENENPIMDSGTSYQPQKGFAYEVTYQKDKAAYTIKEDGTSETVEITNRYYTNVNPSEGVWTEHMKLYLFMAGAGILMILFMILRKTRF